MTRLAIPVPVPRRRAIPRRWVLGDVPEAIGDDNLGRQDRATSTGTSVMPGRRPFAHEHTSADGGLTPIVQVETRGQGHG